MALTSIGDQKTPGRPVEITFEGEQGLPSANQELLLFGHLGEASGTADFNTVVTISNVADPVACLEEVNSKFGAGCEMAKMVIAAVKANQGGSTFPAIKCVPLDVAETEFGTADAALNAARNTKAEYIVSPYDGMDEDLRSKIITHAQTVSGAQRVENNQFGSFAVFANQDIEDASTLDQFDSRFGIGIYKRDLAVSPEYSDAEVAAAAAARMAANGAPFNPLDDVTIIDMPAPEDEDDNLSKGAGLESEIVLGLGWTPLFTKPNGEVAFVRTVSGRISDDGSGSPVVTAYYDVQDFNVLYLWRKTVYTRLAQPDFKRAKASLAVANKIKSELLRLAKDFEDQTMFQNVSDFAKEFKVQRSASDRHRFDVLTPVNVVPGLHVIASNIAASTRFDTLTV